MNVVLSTLNSKFIHSSLALRYLKAYGEAHGQAYDIVEYTINMPVLHILSDITEHDIDVLGFACYIWNIEMTLHVVDMVKAVRPDIKIVLGGPEVSFTADELLERCPNIDYIVQGEGEEAFHDLVTALQLGNDGLDPVIPGVRGRRDGSILGSLEAVEVSDLSSIPFPYTEEDMEDLEHKIIYYESSRGCPFSCQYCLSGNKNTVRFFPQERTLEELQWFIDHGVKQVKFVDRTFNCAPHHHRPLMEFMRDSDTDMNFHLEMEPELMTEWETNILCETPPGRIQIEVGVQSTHKKTLDAINRYNDWRPYIQKSIRPIIQAGRTHVHMDLIVGLPHEDFKRFGQSFNDLFSLQPHALQIGFLKLLKGSGVRRMREYKYVADPLAPYEVLSTHVLPYDDVRFLKYFEDVFERFYNSERFRTTFGYIGQQLIHGETDAFTYFCDMTRAWLKEGNHKVNLKDIDQIEFLYRFLLTKGDTIAAELLQYDTLVSYRGKVRSDAVGLPKQTKELLQVGEAFWRNEEIASTFIPNYTFKEWRKIRQQYVEMTMSRETATYLGIQHIPEGAFTVIIDVNKEVTPFIRPENIQ